MCVVKDQISSCPSRTQAILLEEATVIRVVDREKFTIPQNTHVFVVQDLPGDFTKIVWNNQEFEIKDTVQAKWNQPTEDPIGVT